MKQLPVPFPMAACLTEDKRHRYILTSLTYGFPKLERKPIGEGSLSLVAYGPSLKDTWETITRPMMTMSGAHDFLIERGVVPDYHCDVDPRPHKTWMLTPHKDVHYLMGTVCNPAMWVKLKDFNVTTWHCINGPDTPRFLAKFDPNTLMLSGWSCIGLTAIHLGGVMGFDHFEIHGMDGSWSDGERTAGQHLGVVHGQIEQELSGRKFLVSRMMLNANTELQYILQNYPVFCVFHGDGYNQHWVRNQDLMTCAVEGTERADRIRKSRWLEVRMA